MNINGWKILLIAAVLQISVASLAKAAQSGAGGWCSSSSFSRAIGYILRGFLLGEMEVSTVMECKKRCVVSANCLSLNILTNVDGSFVCQLNSERKEAGAKEQFVPHGAGEYYGLKEKRICEEKGQSCSSDIQWHAFNQSYFKVVETALNFQDAMEFCRAEKGDLASVASEEEQTFLFKNFLENTSTAKWIGSNDIEEEGVFVWTDGSPVTHLRWFPGEPDNYGTGENCMYLTRDTGDMRDVPCTIDLHFICETKYSQMFV